jgi:hypothetical protein
MRYTVDSSAPDRKKECRRKTFPSMAGGLIDCGLCLQPLLSSPDPRRVRVEDALRFLSALFVQPIALEVALRVLSASLSFQPQSTMLGASFQPREAAMAERKWTGHTLVKRKNQKQRLTPQSRH